MWVKFELTGALEEQFKQLCDEECRTLSQQGLYIIKQYLKNNCVEQNKQENNVVEQARTDENESEHIRTELKQAEPKVVNIQAKKEETEEQTRTYENKTEQIGTEQDKQDDFKNMEDDLVLDVLNF